MLFTPNRGIEQFSIEWRKTKTKVIYSGQSQGTQRNPLSNQTSKQLHEAQENLRLQVMIGFDWLRKWRELFFKADHWAKQCKTKVNANYFRHSSENRSIA